MSKSSNITRRCVDMVFSSNLATHCTWHWLDIIDLICSILSKVSRETTRESVRTRERKYARERERERVKEKERESVNVLESRLPPQFTTSTKSRVTLLDVELTWFFSSNLAPHCTRNWLDRIDERWGAGVKTQKNIREDIGGWGRVLFNEPYAPSLSTIYDGA